MPDKSAESTQTTLEINDLRDFERPPSPPRFCLTFRGEPEFSECDQPRRNKRNGQPFILHPSYFSL